MTGLSITSSELPGGWHCLAVQGEIDLATVPELEQAIDSAFGANSQALAVDLRDTSFMDSTGLKALVMASRRFDENGRQFAIAVSRGPVSRLIDLSGVDGSIRVVETVEGLESSSA
jgi:anti-sigma B factor antagonist